MYTAEMAKREQIRKAHRIHAVRRQRERRVTVLILLVTFITVFMIGLGFGTMLAKAQESGQPDTVKYYRTISVERGDTIWDIASDYMDEEHYHSHDDYMKEIMKINHVSSDGQIVSGQILVIPYYSNDTGSSIF